MQPKTLKLFAEFCETFLPEASSSMAVIQQHPGGKDVIQKLHKDQKLAHDISYSPVAKISWSELKDSLGYHTRRQRYWCYQSQRWQHRRLFCCSQHRW
jgi:hypothetical protein